MQALDFIEQNKADFGIRKVKRIDVSGAFHTPLMEPAAEIVKEALKKTTVNNPRIPVHSNVDARVMMKDSEIKKAIPKQIVSPVKWEQITAKMFRDYRDESFMPQVFECGPGNALSVMLYKVNGKAGRRATCISV